MAVEIEDGRTDSSVADAAVLATVNSLHEADLAELCHALSALHLKGVGLDTCSPDHADSAQLPRHRTLLNQGESVIIENLCNLQALPAGPFTFICLPLKLIDAEASVTRAVAIISDVD